MSTLLERIFSQILEMSVIAGYCVLAVLVLRWLFRKAPKRYTYLLWLVVAFRLVCPLTVDSAFSIFNLKLLPESIQTESELGDDVAELPGTELPDVMPEVGGEVSEQPGIVPEINGNINVIPEVEGAANEQPGNSGEMVTPDFGPEISDDQNAVQKMPDEGIGWEQTMNWLGRINWQTVGAWVWVFGMIILAAIMLVSWIRLRVRVRTAVKVRTRVYETDEIDSAFVMGIRKPTIYLPMGLNRQEQAWILLHETCHIWRKDYLVKAFATVLTIVYWFNPLVWVAWFGMCRDMEMSCDEMALEGASAEMRKAYSRTLLTVATNKKLNWNAITAFGEVSVKSRIKHVLSFKKPAVWMGALFAVVLVVVLAVFGTNGQANEEIGTSAGETVETEVSTEAEEKEQEEGAHETTENSTEEDLSDEEVSMMDAMQNGLWLRMLSDLDGHRKTCCPTAMGREADLRHQFNESYEVEMLLEPFAYAGTSYNVEALYNSDSLASLGWYWTEEYGGVALTERHENMDSENLRPSYNYWAKSYDTPYFRLSYLSAKKVAVLGISGTVTKECFERGEEFIESTFPYHYYLMWGSVLSEAGEIWQNLNGSYLGRMAGQAYMTSFDYENLTGVFWICLENEDPVQMTMTFKSQDGGKKDAQIDASAVWSDAIAADAMMKMSFDLETTDSVEYDEQDRKDEAEAKVEETREVVIIPQPELEKVYLTSPYVREELELDMPVRADTIAGNDRYVYIYGYNGYSGEELSVTQNHIVSRCNPDGSGLETIYTYSEYISKEDWGWGYNRTRGERIWRMAVDEDGNLLLVMHRWSPEEDVWVLTKWNCEGEELWATEIEGGTSTSIKTPVYTEDHIFVGNHNDILIYDNDGNLVKKMDSVPNMYWSLCVAKDGQLYANYMRSDSPVDEGMVEVDWESGTLGEEIIPCWKNEYEYIVAGNDYGYDYDFLLYNIDSLVGWNVGEDFCTVLTNSSVGGEDIPSIYQVIAVGEDTYWVRTNSAGRFELWSRAE